MRTLFSFFILFIPICLCFSEEESAGTDFSIVQQIAAEISGTQIRVVGFDGSEIFVDAKLSYRTRSPLSSSVVYHYIGRSFFITTSIAGADVDLPFNSLVRMTRPEKKPNEDKYNSTHWIFLFLDGTSVLGTVSLNCTILGYHPEYGFEIRVDVHKAKEIVFDTEKTR